MSKMFIKMSYMLAILAWMILFSFGVMAYEGSVLHYSLFSLLFSLLLLSALIKPPCFSYLFFSVMLWLGFWLKFTYHTIFKLPYQEPVGMFVRSSTSLDHLLFVSSIGCIGILLARWLYSTKFKPTHLLFVNENISVPQWYLNHGKILWSALITVMALVFAINFWLDIFHVGVVTKTILVWPLNAMLSWVLTSGFALIISTFLWWEFNQKKSLVNGFLCVLLEALMMSVTILSRALYIFHVIPVITTWLLYRKKANPMSYKKQLALAVTSVLFFFLSLQGVTVLRNFYYDNTHINFELNDLKSPIFVRVFNQLAIKRWLGVEGVMAVSSYSDIGWHTFKEALLEKPEIGKVGVYYRIASANYHFDRAHYIFGTLPGLIGFLYMSGSLLFVLFGTFLVVMGMMFFERLVYYLTKNPFLCALFSMTLANTVAQIGVAPRMILKQYLLIYAYLLIVYILQNRQYYATLMAKLQFIRARSMTTG